MPKAAVKRETISIADYLELEQSSQVRHEYLAGQVFALAGASETHNIIALNLAAELRSRLRGGPCRVFISDMKVRVASADTIYYPDVVVTCSAGDNDAYVKKQPCLVAEILSPATEATDRREKLLIYRQLPSLREYLLVAQDRRRVEIHYLAAGGIWQYQVVESGDLTLRSLGLDIPFDELYAGLTI
jgi:Uma2 family endonuclease